MQWIGKNLYYCCKYYIYFVIKTVIVELFCIFIFLIIIFLQALRQRPAAHSRHDGTHILLLPQTKLDI